jgi:hypothetical protein
VVNASVISAYIIFGFPQETPFRQPVNNPTKWTDALLHTLQYLGFIINSRLMTVSWPRDKWQKLANMLDTTWFAVDNPVLTPKEISQVLG